MRGFTVYKQEDGSGTLTQRDPITLVTCYKTNIHETSQYNINIKQDYSIVPASYPCRRYVLF